MDAWAALLALVAELHPHEVEALLRYILLAGGEQSVEKARRSILLHVPTVEAPLASAGEQLIQQGIQRGLQQGRQEGRQEGVRARQPRQTGTRLVQGRGGRGEGCWRRNANDPRDQQA
jgi:flagellar biosynthesis/type III secretory pathway protein FliH